MATKKTTAAEGEGPFFYACEHQRSNDPCPKGCNGPDAEPMPDNWAENYEPEKT